MFRGNIILILFFTAAMLSPRISYADQYGQGTYGQGVVLGKGGEVTIEHQPIEAGLKENVGAAGIVILGSSFVLYYLHKRQLKVSKVSL